MGCATAALSEQGEYEPVGTVLSYVLGGSPCVVGNLWNVSSSDCDRFTKAMLDHWFNGKSITESIVRARDATRSKYLMGAATVCYGIPTYIKR